MPRYYYTKDEPPTGWKCIAATVTSATPNAATEFAFGLGTGLLSEGVYIRNDDANTISVSLDGGTTYFDLAAGEDMDCGVARTSVHVKSASASQAFTLLVGGAI